MGIDQDDCRYPLNEAGDEWVVDEWAVEVQLILGSYGEISPGERGLHGLAKGEVPDGGYRNGKLEMYDSGRFFTVTGNHFPGTPTTIHERYEEIRQIHEKYIAGDDTNTDFERSQVEPAEIALSDQKLIERAINAANGDKFRRLWKGDTSDYPSHSEADQALCNMLAFWTGGDPARIERLFEQSGLVRDKWRERTDYRERTIHNAIQDCQAFYDVEYDE